MFRPSAARIVLERELEKLLPTLPGGTVLDVGSKRAPYRQAIAASEYVTMDIRSDVGADLVGDVHDIPRPEASFDTVIATELLEHCREPQQAIDEMRRVLRPGGVCVLSTRFLYPVHADPHDYFRFTADGLTYLFREWKSVDVIPIGGRLVSAWMLVPLRGFKRATYLFDRLVALGPTGSRTRAACGYLVHAVK